MKLSRKRGRTVLAFDDTEAGVLRDLFAELTAIVEDPQPDDPVTDRLNPSARPDDEHAAAEFRSLTESALVEERLARTAECTADLDGRPIDLGDPDVARRWIQTLNDLRLAIGTRLGITEDEPPFRPDEAADQRLVYYWLTGVQDAVVGQLLR